MSVKVCAILFLNLLVLFDNASSQDAKHNTVLVAILARNKELTLPYFLTLFEELDYPKDRMSLFIRSDHNNDKTIKILEKWLSVHRKEYHSVDVTLRKDSPILYPDEVSPTNWTNARFNHVIKLKNDALKKGRQLWAEFIWFLDVDTYLMDPYILHDLINQDRSIVSPMINSLGTYSNFWCGMTSQFWYRRTDEYLPILDRKKTGCFPVPMVHTCVLVDLRKVASDELSFDPYDIKDYAGPRDDIIAFAIGAANVGLQMYVCNHLGYSFITPPLQDTDTIDKDIQLFSDLKLEILVLHEPLKASPLLESFTHPFPKKDKLGFDEAYLINLARRPDRAKRMYHTFDELGLDVRYFEAVDGKKLNESLLQNMGFKQMDLYKDPWWIRDMTYGEIGCFLSHYYIWEDMVKNQYEKVIVFEDDIRFEPYFRSKMNYMMNQMKMLSLPWNLVYLGRKRMKNYDEPWVKGSDILVHADYSYWTLCYILNLEGAKKLLRYQPISNMVPVDEYIPIMFDKHPELEWMKRYPLRDLVAYSAEPLMVQPTHYTGDEGYISDTEESVVVDTLDTKDSSIAGGSQITPMGPDGAVGASLQQHPGGVISAKDEL